MNVSRMSDQGVVDTLNEICDGLCAFAKENPESNETILDMLKEELLDDIEETVEVIAEHDSVENFCEEIKNIIIMRPEIAKTLLELMIENVLDPLAEDDFWGTEGWEHRFGME
jgi:uncharacterized protein YutE (UPF0331/DUF86 family)